jgi:hypothetical protein
MALSAFDDPTFQPQDGDLAEMLGRTSGLWNELKATVSTLYAPVDEVWSFSGAKYGWSMRLIRKKRTIVYMIPCKRHFLAAFVLGDRAMEAARHADLPAGVMTSIEAATKYVEGTGFRLEVRNKKDLGAMLKLAAIKMAK